MSDEALIAYFDGDPDEMARASGQPPRATQTRTDRSRLPRTSFDTNTASRPCSSGRQTQGTSHSAVSCDP